MSRFAVALGAGCLIAVTLAAQQAAPAFEVASVKRNVSNAPGSSGGVSPGGLVTIVNMPVRNLLRNILELQDAQLIGGPDWLASERYDITAKSNEGMRPPVVIEAVLKDRFKLIYHKETRVLPVYALVRETATRWVRTCERRSWTALIEPPQRELGVLNAASTGRRYRSA